MRVARIVLIALVLWLSLTSIIQRLKNPSLTETQLFFLIPKNSILKFEHQKKPLTPAEVEMEFVRWRDSIRKVEGLDSADFYIHK